MDRVIKVTESFDELFKPTTEDYKALRRLKTIVSRELDNSPIFKNLLEEYNASLKFLRESRKKNSPKYYHYEIVYKHKKLGLSKSFKYTIEEARKRDVISYLKESKTAFIESIKYSRNENKRMNLHRKMFYYHDGENSHSYNLLGLTHQGKGEILHFNTIKKSKDIFFSKKPKDEKNYIGIELEFYSKLDKTELAAKLTEANLQRHANLKFDGSIRADSGYHPHELTLLVNEDEYQDVVKKVCSILKAAKSQVNESCGMHVHFDMRKRDKDIIYHNLVTAQPILYAMNPASRATIKYCKKNTSKKFPEQPKDRYVGINPVAYGTHKTIEIRIHSGTINERKIINWVKLLNTIVNYKEMIKRGPISYRAFVNKFGLDIEMAEYIAERIEKFNSAPHDNEKLEGESNAA